MMLGGNQPSIVNGIPLVDGGAAEIVELVLVPQQPCITLHNYRCTSF